MVKSFLLLMALVAGVYGEEHSVKKGDTNNLAYWQAYCEQIAAGESYFKKTNFNVAMKKCLCKEAGFKKHCIGKSSK